MGFSQVAVLASAQTELRPAWNDAQHIDLISSVVTNVFKGTGLTLDDVDFIIDSGSDVLDGRSISNCGFLGALGAHHKEEARVEEDGLWGALYGVNKIRSGASKIGLIVAYSKPSESSIDLYWSAMVEPFYQRPVGFGQKAALGIQAQRYLAAHGITDRELADLVARRWAAAAGNGCLAVRGRGRRTHDPVRRPPQPAQSHAVERAAGHLLRDDDRGRGKSRPFRLSRPVGARAALPR